MNSEKRSRTVRNDSLDMATIVPHRSRKGNSHANSPARQAEAPYLERLACHPLEETRVREQLVLGDSPLGTVGVNLLDVTGARTMEREIGDACWEVGEEALERGPAVGLMLVGQAHEERVSEGEGTGLAAGFLQRRYVHPSHLEDR